MTQESKLMNIIERIEKAAFDLHKDGIDEGTLATFYTAISDLKREIEQDKRDAERVNFIQNEWFYQDHSGEWLFNFNESWNGFCGKNLREAIDAAISAKKDGVT